MNKDKRKKIEAAGHKIMSASEVMGLSHRPKPAKIELSYSDMHLIASWFIGYELSNAILIENECRKQTGKHWKYERIMEAFKAGKIGSSTFREFLEAATTHVKKGLSLRNRLWADFKQNQPKKRKRKKKR